MKRFNERNQLHKWIYYAKHAKKLRTRKKYQKKIREYWANKRKSIITSGNWTFGGNWTYGRRAGLWPIMDAEGRRLSPLNLYKFEGGKNFD